MRTCTQRRKPGDDTGERRRETGWTPCAGSDQSLVLCLAVTAFGRRPRTSFRQADQGRGAVRAGQRHRHRHPHRRRADAARCSAQPIVIENKPGAFGILAIEEMARVAAGRLHAADRQSRHQRADADHLQEEIQDRLRQGRHDGDAARARCRSCSPRPPRTSRRRLTPSSSPTPRRTRQGALCQRRHRQQQSL